MAKIRYIENTPCETKSEPAKKPSTSAPATRAKLPSHVSDDMPIANAPKPPKYDRNAAHKAYMKKYMREYRKRQKETGIGLRSE